ncbi:MAG: DUF4097 family beta strand repeat-containing protein [Blastocatellia bacterium]
MQPVSKRMAIRAAAVCALLTASVWAQDFRKSYELGAGSGISVRNISGDVSVTGYEGETILVLGYKEGRDREKVTIEESQTGGGLSIRARYPENCNCNASVRFEVRVPRATGYKFDTISSISGDVEMSGVAGEVHAKSVSGNVTVRNASGPVEAKSTSGNVIVGEINGTVTAKSVSGNVDVEIMQLSGAQDMDFASVSGNVRVKLPAGLDAEVKMSTMSGGLKTDFPLTVEEPERGPGRRATGRVGGGSRQLKLSSVSGNVSLLRM